MKLNKAVQSFIQSAREEREHNECGSEKLAKWNNNQKYHHLSFF